MLITGRLNHSSEDSLHNASTRDSVPRNYCTVWGPREPDVVVRVLVTWFYLFLSGPSPVFVSCLVTGAPLFGNLELVDGYFHCARTTRAGGHAPLGNEEMRNVTGQSTEWSGYGEGQWMG